MDQRQNYVNSFLDSMDGQADADPFANAQTATEQEMPPVASKMAQQVSSPVQPACTWPIEQVGMLMQQAPVQQPQATYGVPIPEEQPTVQTPAPIQQSFDVIGGGAATPAQQQPIDPFQQALNNATAQQDERMVEALKVKKPFFSYGKAKDEIDDADITFEELREKYETDFPELSDSKLVTWSVTYGKVTKSISNPSSDQVYTVKSEIEKSKAFLDGLRKAKTDAEKNPECLAKPFKKAQSKGKFKMPGYKEFCFTEAEARMSQKAIVVLPSKDGRLFEMRKNEIGVFTAPVTYVKEFDDLKSGFEFTLPKIPFSILLQIFSFFKQLSDKFRFEALVHILYDTELQKYCIKVPKQQISTVSVDSESENYGERFIHVMDIHSHNSMPAVFSDTDNSDEKSTRLYAVAGRFNRLFPELTVRAGCGGKFIPVEPSDVFELNNSTEYPQEWNNNLKAPTLYKLKMPFFRRMLLTNLKQSTHPDHVPF